MSVVTTCIKACLSKKKIVFFGAGQYSSVAIGNLRRRISYFCDNSGHRQGTLFSGIPVLSPDKLLDENREETVIIINTEHYREIARQLLIIGFKDIYSREYKNGNERIPSSEAEGANFLVKRAEVISGLNPARIERLFADELSKTVFRGLLEKYRSGDFDFSGICTKDAIYFNDIFKDEIRENEVYIDAGVFDGRTITDFIIYAEDSYGKIYGFEPDITNYAAVVREFLDCRDTFIENMGISDTAGIAYFDARGTQSSKIIQGIGIENDRLSQIHTTTIDSYIRDCVTLIKMDIEGGEYKALLGAQKTITALKPKLAVSVYHEDDDLIKIPLLIHEMVPEYKLYLRHHTNLSVDTVLYAKI
jgi:FkbM family methyltransferase